MLLLALETATDVCSACLWHDDRPVATVTLHRPRLHAEFLAPILQDVLEFGGVKANALDAVALSAGPGSYTGLRIGTATAKGMCFSAEAALIPVSTLGGLALRAAPAVHPGNLILPTFDARRGQLFGALYRKTETGIEEITPACLLDAVEVAGLVPESTPVWLCGDGAELALTAPFEHTVHLLPDVRPDAEAVARLGAEQLAAGKKADLATFEPFYLRTYTPRLGGSVFDKISS